LLVLYVTDAGRNVACVTPPASAESLLVLVPGLAALKMEYHLIHALVLVSAPQWPELRLVGRFGGLPLAHRGYPEGWKYAAKQTGVLIVMFSIEHHRAGPRPRSRAFAWV
jgi:hypothetical protein